MKSHRSFQFFFEKSEDEKIIDTLTCAFQNNHRMRALIGKRGKYLKDGIQIVIAYCYYMVKKLGGVFESKDRATYLFYYLKSEFYFSFRDVLNYLYLAIFVVGIKRLKQVYSRERFIKKIRQLQILKQQDKDFLYVWFLAQKQEEKSLRGLMEAKQFIIEKARNLNLPIYMETTEARLVRIYERMGFEFYDFQNDPMTGLKIWFGRYSTQ